MGCDIHTRAQKRENGKWVNLPFEPFDWRSYGMFGFLAGVRNYSAVPPIAAPRGLPPDIVRAPPNFYSEHDDEYAGLGDHSFSWLSVEELMAFDYDQQFEDRRVTRQIAPNFWNGGVTGEPGEGKIVTFRAFLGEGFFADLAKLREMGAERVLFGFDS